MKTLNNSESSKCPLGKCDGTGWLYIEKGGTIYCKACECQEIEKMKNILKQSGISEEFQNITFQTYQTYNEPTKQAKILAIEYIKNFDEIKQSRYNSIAFLGQVGAGKTHLSIAIANNLLSKGIPVMYMPYRDKVTELKHLLTYKEDDEESYNKEINKLKQCKVLLIDDLFKGKLTDTDKNIMFEILNSRYLAHLPIIVSSEFSIDRLIDFDEAIGSRIVEMCKDYIFQFEGQENNYRLRGIIKEE